MKIVLLLNLIPAETSSFAVERTGIVGMKDQACSNLYDAGRVTDQKDSWDNDTDYWLTDVTPRPATDGRLQTYYSGDTLHISRADFDSLYTNYNAPNPNQTKVTFDARKIIVDMPLRLTSTKIVLLADQIIFTNRAQIYFSSSPKQNDDGIEIICDTLDLRDALNIPFNFVTKQSNWPASPVRGVTVSAKQILTKSATPPSDWTAYVRGLTLDNKRKVDSSSYQVEVGSLVAEQNYQKALDERVMWPFTLAAKVARHFAAAPYQRDNLELLEDMASKHIRILTADRFSYPRALLVRTVTAIRTGIDLDGKQPAYIPRRSYDDLLEYFGNAVKEAKGQLDLWLGDLQEQADNEQQKETRKNLRDQTALKIESLQAKSMELADKITELTTRFNVVEGLKVNKEHQIRVETDNLARCRKEMEDKEKTKSQLDAALTLFALAGTAATAALCPPAAPAVAGSLKTGQMVIIGHQDGHDIQNPNDIIEVAKAGVAAGEEVKTKYNTLKDSYKKVADAIKNIGAEKNPTQLKDLGDAINEAAQASKEVVTLVKSLRAPPVDPTVLAQRVARDCSTEYFARLQQEFEAYNVEQGRLNGEIMSFGNQLVQIGSEMATEKTRLVELDAILPTNDRERVQHQQTSLTLWDDLYARLASMAPDTPRAYAYFTGDNLHLLDAFRVYNSTYLTTKETMKRIREAQHSPKSIDVASMKKLVDEQYERFGTQTFQWESEKQGFQSRVFPSATIPHVFKASLHPSSHRAMEKTLNVFLTDINSDIARQIRQIKEDPQSVTRGSPILIPLNVQGLFRGLGTWAQLVNIEVTDLRFKDRSAMEDKSFDLTLFHPGYGKISKDGRCYFVDFRDFAAQENRIAFPSIVYTDGTLENGKRDDSGYARPPFEAPYYLELSVRRVRDDNDWTSWGYIPEVSSMTIRFTTRERKQ